VRRHAPDRPFPRYAYLPGRDPHPVRDPRGHSFEADEEHGVWLEPGRWRENGLYLWGVDLYNHGYLWEAHEAWETQWHAAKHDVDQADVLQGLIQCAAACLKIPMEQPRGLEKLAAAGTGRLERVARERGGRYMGLDLAAFVQAFRAFVAHAPDDVDDRPRLELG
jgi:hypothetical protein